MHKILDAEEPELPSHDVHLICLEISLVLHLIFYIHGTMGNFCRFHFLGMAIEAVIMLFSLAVFFYIGKRVGRWKWLVTGFCVGINLLAGLGNYMIIC